MKKNKFNITSMHISLLISFCLMLVAFGSVWILRFTDAELVDGEKQENTFDYSNVNFDGTFWSYEDDLYSTIPGIDVSEHQEEIDWEKVKNAGIKFAMIRVGYRGTESGACTEDKYFKKNIQGALENGIDVGVYFFSQAINVNEAREEAWFVLDRIQDYEITMPVAFDMEYPEIGTNRIELLTAHEKTKIANMYLTLIERNGYTPMIYGSSNTIGEHFELDYLTKFKTWIADYDTYVKYPYEFMMWQYSESGYIDGVGTVDLDMLFKKKTEL